MTGKQFREAARPRPLEMAAAVIATIFFVFFLPVQGNDFAARIVCFVVGAGTFGIVAEYIRAARAKEMASLSATLTPRCGVPLAAGGFCNEPASPGCCYCDLHAKYPNGKWSKKA